MGELVWDKPGQRFFEAGLDRGVLYPNGSTGVAWNGLISVDEEVAGGEPEAYYFDGIKYWDNVASEDFQATIQAYTYPDEFEPCLGLVRLASGMILTHQPRQPFGLSWRTKIGNDINGLDHGSRIHIVYNLTAAPSAKSYQSNTENANPVNFSWTVNAVPILPGMGLGSSGGDPNVDPADWMWPTGPGMVGWPVGPDGNTPVPGWIATPYVVIDENSIDPEIFSKLTDHLNGTLQTMPSLPSPIDLANFLNGQQDLPPAPLDTSYVPPDPGDTGGTVNYGPVLVGPYQLRTSPPVALVQSGRDGWPNPIMAFNDQSKVWVDENDDTFVRTTMYRQDATWGTASTNYASARVIGAIGDSSHIDGMTWTARIRAANTLGLTTQKAYFNFHNADFSLELDFTYDVPVDDAWHDVSIIWTRQGIIDWGTDPDALWLAMTNGKMMIDCSVGGPSALAESFTQTIDFTRVGLASKFISPQTMEWSDSGAPVGSSGAADIPYSDRPLNLTLTDPGRTTVILHFPAVPDVTRIDWTSLVATMGSDPSNPYGGKVYPYFGSSVPGSSGQQQWQEMPPYPKALVGVETLNTTPYLNDDGTLTLFPGWDHPDDGREFVAALKAGQFYIVLEYHSPGPLLPEHVYSYSFHELNLAYYTD